MTSSILVLRILTLSFFVVAFTSFHCTINPRTCKGGNMSKKKKKKKVVVDLKENFSQA